MGLFDIFGTGDQEQAARDQINALAKANTEGQGYLTQGYGNITGNLAAGLSPLLTNYSLQQPGTSAYGDATGANGADGTARALAAFKNTNPGYQFTLDQGTQNVLRTQAAQGALNSGNTDKAVADYTTGLANNTWDQYVKNLQPFLGASTVTGGQIANTNLQGANLQNTNRTNAANMVYGTNVGQGNAQASADLAGLNASANGINAIMNGGKLAGSLLGFL